jgi:lysophospholipase L1-like esterase
VVVLYAGDNDIAYGLSPQAVADDYADFSRQLHAALPEVRVVYISIKPSLARWQLFPRMQEANVRIRKHIEGEPRAFFLDVGPAMLDANGKPRRELFAADGLHLSGEGYALWTQLLQPVLEKALADARSR